MMTCPSVRDALTQASAVPQRFDRSPVVAPAVRDHLDRCPDCERFAERLTIARSMLAAPASEHLPGAGFAAGVQRQIRHQTANGWSRSTAVLGSAALRLLPVTAALVLLLTGWAIIDTPAPTRLFEQASIDPLVEWVSWSADDLATPPSTDDSP